MQLYPDLTQPRNKARPIFETLRGEILAGRFKAGEKLPGTRTLAERLGVARGTVNMAIAMLAADGLIEIRAASGAHIAVAVKTAHRKRSLHTAKLSDWGKRLPEPSGGENHAFFSSQPTSDSFPEREWQRALRTSLRSAEYLNPKIPPGPAGFAGLRESIAAHLNYSRSLTVTADNVVIVNGSMQAITLLSQLLIGKGDRAAFENPGFHGIRDAVHATGARGIACPVDAEGMRLPQEKCKLVLVTPASQFPTGVTMSYARRSELLEYARQHESFIVEDEYDSEFSRFANPPQPLKLIDQDDRVVYIGSFSRTMFNSLRLGYCVLPDALTLPFLRARQLYDTTPPALIDQMAMAHFISSGNYRLHLRRMNKIYAERHNKLYEGLGKRAGGFFNLQPSAAGLSIFATWKKSRTEFENLRRRFQENGVAWQDVQRYYAGKPASSAIFGFAKLALPEIQTALEKISTLVG